MPFNQIIDLNTAGNAGRNSYEILMMQTSVIDITRTTVGLTPQTAIEAISLPPGYLRVGDCIRASVSARWIVGFGFRAEFYVSLEQSQALGVQPLSVSIVDMSTSSTIGGTTMGVGHVYQSQSAIPQPGDAFIQCLASLTPHPPDIASNIITMGQGPFTMDVNLRLPITIGLYGFMDKYSGGGTLSRARCDYYCVEVLRRAN